MANSLNHETCKCTHKVCPICMNKLSEPSGFEDEVPASSPSAAAEEGSLNVYKLRKCGHKLHYACLTMYLKNSSKVRDTIDTPDDQATVYDL